MQFTINLTNSILLLKTSILNFPSPTLSHLFFAFVVSGDHGASTPCMRVCVRFVLVLFYLVFAFMFFIIGFLATFNCLIVMYICSFVCLLCSTFVLLVLVLLCYIEF